MFSRISATTAILAALAPALAITPAKAADTPIVASFKPLHSLVTMVVGDTGLPVGVLLDGSASPHHASLKPSQRQMIADARKVFILSHEFEQFLVKAVDGHPGEVELMSRPGLTLLDWREPEEHHDGHDDHDDHGHDDDHKDEHDDHGHDEHDDDHKDEHDEHDDHAGHDHGGEHDIHIWLDPLNASAMLPHIAAELGEVWPEHRDAFYANAGRGQGALHALHEEISAELAPLEGEGIIVFHDAFQYFDSRYDLKFLASILDGHGGALSAARLHELEELIEHEKVSCIFTEPQFDEKIARHLTEDSGAKLAVMDPLGADIPAGPGHYPAMMRAIAAAVASCKS